MVTGVGNGGFMCILYCNSYGWGSKFKWDGMNSDMIVIINEVCLDFYHFESEKGLRRGVEICL